MRKHFTVSVLLTLLSISLSPALAQVLAPATAPDPAAVERRVDSLLGQMTLEEKIDLLGGVDGFFIRGIPRLSLPRLKMADGPMGVRNFGPATAMAGGIGLAATWNPTLAARVGTEIGRDARAKGVHFLLGPGVNIYRAPMNGRNFEYFGEDPFLASRIAVGYIKGVQSQGVSATVKHFMGNNSEFDRHNTDTIIDERTMREIYLPVFEAAVKEARVGAIMDSYNLINGAHLTQNGYLNTDVAKNEWGFRGIMMSDWTSTYDGIAAANGGLDLEMPSGAFMNRKTLLPAIQQGKVTVATIDDKVRRILRTAIQFGWIDRDQTDLSIPRFNQQGRSVALAAALESQVLLKNEGGLLPLDKKKIRSIAVIGPDAYPAVPVGGGSARVEPFVATSILEGISNYLGGAVPVYYARGLPSLAEMADATSFSTEPVSGQPGLRSEYFSSNDLQGTPLTTRTEQHINFRAGAREFPAATLSARWAGYYVVKDTGDYDIFVASSGEDGGYYRLFLDGKVVFDSWATAPTAVSQARVTLDTRAHKIVLEQHGRSRWIGSRFQFSISRTGTLADAEGKKLAAKADVVVLAVGFDPGSESEGADRTFSLPPGQDQLIQEIAAVNKNTIVVLTSGGSAAMDAWLDRVPALIETWYPGQEGGTALAENLFGEVNPSGRLPVTFERRWEDNPVHDNYYPTAGSNRVAYKEGVFVGYRGYEKNNTQPLFPFGFGLSYTTFKYSNLAIKPLKSGSYEVSFEVKNTGIREGAEVAQVYVGGTHASVPRPAKELKGFSKVSLRPGETKRVTVALDTRALSYYDVNAKQWRAEAGDYDVLVGHSSAQIELRGRLSLSTAVTARE
ncbi:MAG TPA: glycoside hydrolase family 3 C-terminal domain-containing protein [Pyrinomonadaceae bacterium]|nr:glycoside hydrolase family 3 C-terminal domain-containing protein [Pyrinomonadaceae bacterium]